MNGAGPIILIVLVLAVAIVAIVASAAAARRRREALAGLAQELGWSFEPESTGPWGEHEGFGCFQRGHSRRAYNTLRGPVTIDGREFEGLAGDFLYKITTSNGKTTTTTTYRFSYLIARLPFSTPPLVIRREGLMDKLKGALGFDDIDFESSEFSRKFYVQSGDKKFAYDVVSPKMMEFLLAGGCPGVSIANSLCCVTDGSNSWEPVEFRGRIGWTTTFFDLWPDFLTQQLDSGRA